MPSCCWTGESAGPPSLRILSLVRLLGFGGGGGAEWVESMLHWFDSFTVFNAVASVHTRAHRLCGRVECLRISTLQILGCAASAPN